MFESKFKEIENVLLPEFSGIRIMMMPLLMNDINSVPEFLDGYKDTIKSLFEISDCKSGVGYLTIDEKLVKYGETHRRKGLHVDGIHKDMPGSWGGGGWGSRGSGMLTVSSEIGCKAYNQKFFGYPNPEGDCDHLRNQLSEDKSKLFNKNTVYWVDGLCVHESIEMPKDTNRIFVRLSNPSDGAWFEGYTENPLGIKPSGKILPKRKFMDI